MQYKNPYKVVKHLNEMLERLENYTVRPYSTSFTSCAWKVLHLPAKTPEITIHANVQHTGCITITIHGGGLHSEQVTYYAWQLPAQRRLKDVITAAIALIIENTTGKENK